jgi:outer membrane receptor protein involved in Fe transport
MLPDMARHKGNIEVGFKLSASSAKTGKPNMLGIFRSLSDEFSFYLHLFLSGKRARSAQDLRDDLPGYALLDAAFIAHDVARDGLDVLFSVKNLLDTQYDDPTPEFAPEDPFSIVPDDIPNPGRSVFLELRYRF